MVMNKWSQEIPEGGQENDLAQGLLWRMHKNYMEDTLNSESVQVETWDEGGRLLSLATSRKELYQLEMVPKAGAQAPELSITLLCVLQLTLVKWPQ